MKAYKKEARTMVSPVLKESEADNVVTNVDDMASKNGNRWLTIKSRMRKWLRMALR